MFIRKIINAILLTSLLFADSNQIFSINFVQKELKKFKPNFKISKKTIKQIYNKNKKMIIDYDKIEKEYSKKIDKELKNIKNMPNKLIFGKNGVESTKNMMALNYKFLKTSQNINKTLLQTLPIYKVLSLYLLEMKFRLNKTKNLSYLVIKSQKNVLNKFLIKNKIDYFLLKLYNLKKVDK